MIANLTKCDTSELNFSLQESDIFSIVDKLGPASNIKCGQQQMQQVLSNDEEEFSRASLMSKLKCCYAGDA